MDMGYVSVLIVKDMSRLGSDYLQVGYYTETYFPDRSIRFIAINDCVDSADGENELAPFRNVMNEMYARDISRKVRSAHRIRGNLGEPLGQPPFGYMKGGLSSQVQHFVESNFIGRFPAKAFPWSEIKDSNEPADVFFGKCRYFTALWNKLADQTICVLVCRSFPRRSWMRIKHINPQVLFHLFAFCKFGALVKGNTTNR